MPRRSAGRRSLAARLAFAGAAAVLPLVIASTPAAGASPVACTSPVVDAAHVLGSAGETLAALAPFPGLPAQVFVRTYTSLPNGDPGTQEKLLERQCANWRAADGRRRADLVTVLVDRADRRTGVFFGARWNDALGTDYRVIETTDMNPQFAEGRFDAGVAAGLAAIFTDVHLGQLLADPTMDDNGQIVAADGTVLGSERGSGPVASGTAGIWVLFVFMALAAVGALAAAVFRAPLRSGGRAVPRTFDRRGSAVPPDSGLTSTLFDPTAAGGSPAHHHGGTAGIAFPTTGDFTGGFTSGGSPGGADAGGTSAGGGGGSSSF